MTVETYGEYGGRYVPETLIPALDELERGWADALADPAFREELDRLGARRIVIVTGRTLGASTLLDVLTSQSTLDAARLALIQARQDFRVARAQLESLVGKELQ